MNKIASFISYLFHPILMPLYLGILVLGHYRVLASGDINYNKQLLTLIFTFLPAIIFPLMYIALLKHYKIISSFKMLERKERTLPLIFCISLYGYISYALLNGSYSVPKSLSLIFLVTCISMLLALMINTKLKVSLHSIGVSASASYIYHLLPYSLFDLTPIFITAIILLGLVGWARLQLKAHQENQVFIGYLVGWYCASAILLWFF